MQGHTNIKMSVYLSKYSERDTHFSSFRTPPPPRSSSFLSTTKTEAQTIVTDSTYLFVTTEVELGAHIGRQNVINLFPSNPFFCPLNPSHKECLIHRNVASVLDFLGFCLIWCLHVPDPWLPVQCSFILELYGEIRFTSSSVCLCTRSLRNFDTREIFLRSIWNFKHVPDSWLPAQCSFVLKLCGGIRFTSSSVCLCTRSLRNFDTRENFYEVFEISKHVPDSWLPAQCSFILKLFGEIRFSSSSVCLCTRSLRNFDTREIFLRSIWNFKHVPDSWLPVQCSFILKLRGEIRFTRSSVCLCTGSLRNFYTREIFLQSI